MMTLSHLGSAGLAAAVTLSAVALPACTERTPPPSAGAVVPAGAPDAAVVPVSVPTDAWVGRWIGPEGTYLQIDGKHGLYDVTIRNLDGPQTFPARGAAGGVHFERGGVAESLRATDGAQTGMKWLAGKKVCLTVKAGEGYCRD